MKAEDKLLIQNQLNVQKFILPGVITALLIVLVVTFGTYTSEVIVRGNVASQGGDIEIFSKEAGILTDLKVEIGQKIEAGSPLFTLIKDSSVPSTPAVYAELSSKLAHKRSLLLTDFDLSVRKDTLERQKLETSLDQLEFDISNTQSQLEVLKKKRQLAQEQSDRIATLVTKGHATSHEQYRFSNDFLTLVQSILEAEKQLDGHQRTRSSIARQAQELDLSMLVAKNQLASSLNEIDQQILEMEKNRSIQVVAPKAGIITLIAAQNGQNVQNNTLVLSISPISSEYEALVYIASADIGFVQKNQPVNIALDAYPEEQYGTLKGIVSEVSKAALPPSKIGVESETRDPVFQVRVNLQEKEVMVDDKPFPLQPGMALTAKIATKKESFWRLLL